MQKGLAKKWLLGACIVISALLVAVGSYLLYVVLGYSRIPDNQPLEVKGLAEEQVSTRQPLSLVTYNVGFGAYSADYSFFMDGGEHARAFSKEAVEANIGGALQQMQKTKPDFVLLQEVDQKGTRSYGVDQTQMFAKGFWNYQQIYAQNYDSPYLLYPFHQPIGANRSGMMTFSKYKVTSALRRSLPVEDSLYRFLDLDRAYMKCEIPVANGKTLVLYNLHLSAYTSDGTIADEQLKMLSADMQGELDKGSYVIAGGDFNKDLLGDSGQYFKRLQGEYTWAQPLKTALLPQGVNCYTGKNAPSCRNADKPYKGEGSNFVLATDGVLVSENVQVEACETIDAGFLYSDHQPVWLQFVLLP